MKKDIKTKFIYVLVFSAVALLSAAQTGLAQTNVTLYSVSPTSAPVGTAIVITGSNLLQCAPIYAGGSLDPRCNVQFHDINLRRSTISGQETSNTTVQAYVAAGLCPGTTTIKVGEVNNFSNAIPFTILDQGNVPAGCRVITSIAPTSGTLGTSVTITGRNLHANVQLYNSAFAMTNATGTMNAGATQVVFSMPSGLTPGTYSVRVGPSVSDVSNGLPFNYAGDTSAPYISNIRINNITTTGATVLWDTSEPANGQVEYCPTSTRCTTNTPLIAGLTTAHVVNLTGLTPGARYYLWVKSRDGAGNLATGGPLSLRTQSEVTPTPTPPPAVGTVAISNFQITNIGRYTATVTWTTDIASDSTVVACAFGIFCYRTLATDPALTTNHVLNITGLSQNTSYSIQAQSVASGGERGSSDVVSFRTMPGLSISNIQVVNTTNSGATVSWNTNYPSDTGIIICTYFIFCYVNGLTAYDANMTLNHTITVSGLLSNRRYSFRVISSDPEGSAKGTVQNFTTSN